MRKITGFVLILVIISLSVIAFGDRTDADSQTENAQPVLFQSLDINFILPVSTMQGVH